MSFFSHQTLVCSEGKFPTVLEIFHNWTCSYVVGLVFFLTTLQQLPVSIVHSASVKLKITRLSIDNLTMQSALQYFSVILQYFITLKFKKSCYKQQLLTTWVDINIKNIRKKIFYPKGLKSTKTKKCFNVLIYAFYMAEEIYKSTINVVFYFFNLLMIS